MKRLIRWLFLASIVFALGVGIGLGLAWGVVPARALNMTPETLRQEAKDRYRLLIAEDYAISGDAERAIVRLEIMDTGGVIPAITDQIYRMAWTTEAEENALIAMRAALTGSAITQDQPETPARNDVLETPRFEATQMITSNSRIPTLKPEEKSTASITTTQPHFTVLNRFPVCENGQAPPVLIIQVISLLGKPRNGVVIIVSSVDGSERLITGLKPTLSAGFADLIMRAGIIYTLTIEGVANSSEEFMAAECAAQNGEIFSGGWSLQIQN
jgi:hypothetical protein